jgi:hypothetical protein
MSQFNINSVCTEYSTGVRVQGQVFDATSNETLPLANVYVDVDTTIGTAADMDGNFSIQVPKGTTLVVSFTGYHPFKFMAEEGFIDVYLQADDQLDTVVIHGQNKKKNYNWLWWLLAGGVVLSKVSNSTNKPALGKPMHVKL